MKKFDPGRQRPRPHALLVTPASQIPTAQPARSPGAPLLQAGPPPPSPSWPSSPTQVPPARWALQPPRSPSPLHPFQGLTGPPLPSTASHPLHQGLLLSASSCKVVDIAAGFLPLCRLRLPSTLPVSCPVQTPGSAFPRGSCPHLEASSFLASTDPCPGLLACGL